MTFRRIPAVVGALACALSVALGAYACGSLAGAALCSITTRLAPFGGTLMIVGWLVLAIDCWKHPGGSDGPV